MVAVDRLRLRARGDVRDDVGRAREVAELAGQAVGALARARLDLGLALDRRRSGASSTSKTVNVAPSTISDTSEATRSSTSVRPSTRREGGSCGHRPRRTPIPRSACPRPSPSSVWVVPSVAVSCQVTVAAVVEPAGVAVVERLAVAVDAVELDAVDRVRSSGDGRCHVSVTVSFAARVAVTPAGTWAGVGVDDREHVGPVAPARVVRHGVRVVGVDPVVDDRGRPAGRGRRTIVSSCWGAKCAHRRRGAFAVDLVAGDVALGVRGPLDLHRSEDACGRRRPAAA